jgi:hypothetical protein
MQATELVAGRELDALVAEKVMQKRQPEDFGVVPLHQWEESDYSGYNQYWCPRCRHMSKDWASDHELSEAIAEGFMEAGPCDLPPAPYSTFIVAAMEVVEVLNQRWPDQFQMMAEAKGWTADFIGGVSTSRWAETAPLAICRAALVAIAS